MNPEDIPGLPKVKKGTKTVFGVLCKHHPEHMGYRYANSCDCVACILTKNNRIVGFDPDGTPITYKTARNRKIVGHDPDGTPISYGTAYSRRIVGHDPDGTPISYGTAYYRQIVGYDTDGTPITYGAARSREIVGHDPDGTPISYGAARNREIVGHAPDGTPISRGMAKGREIVDYEPDGTPISYGTAKHREIVRHDPDGTPISYGLAFNREIVGYDQDGTPISRGKAAARRFLATPEGRARGLANHYAYYARLDENTKALNLSEADIALTNQVVEQIQLAGFTVDHMEPASKGGAHVWWNLNGLTKSTNSSKSTKELDLSQLPHWLEMLEQGRAPDYYQRLVSKILRGGNYEPE